MIDEQYKISILIRDAVLDNGDKTSVIGHYSHKAREIVEEARINERNKTINEFAEKIKEYSGSHFIDCDPYWGKPETAFMTELYLDEIVEELKGDTNNE